MEFAYVTLATSVIWEAFTVNVSGLILFEIIALAVFRFEINISLNSHIK